MAIDPNYIPAFSIEEVLLDKDTGAPLAGGVVTFERSLQPGILKAVYQITGTDPNFTYTALPNPMTLSSIGTFQDSLGNPVVPYFLPYDSNFDPDYYRVIVESAGGVEQFVRDPVPYIAGSGEGDFSNAFENDISNPQFAEVLFDTNSATYTYNFNAASLEVVQIAPDWEIVVSSSGVGSVIVSQVTPTGSENIITNPGTILRIDSTGLNYFRLRQRLYGSPNLWGAGNIATSVVAKTFEGSASTITMYYSQSNGAVSDAVLNTITLNADGNYRAYPATATIINSTSIEDFPDAYIDIEFDLPFDTEIGITSVMLSPTGDVSIEEIIYSQESQNRQIDHLFHYYKPQLEFKPIPSLLTGWDFPLNPAQLGDSGNIGAVGGYIWDQTIAARGASAVAYQRNAISGGMQFITPAITNAFYLMQYLTGAQAKEIIANKLACNVHAYTNGVGAITGRVYLYRGSSAATIPTLPTTIGSLSSNGNFTLTAANWTEIPRGNLGAATFTVNQVQTASDNNDYGLSGWQLLDSAEINNTDKFAIVVTFAHNATPTELVVNSISIVKGDIPTRPAPQTKDQVLRECEYYYEQSTEPGTLPTSGTLTGSVMSYQPDEYDSAATSHGWYRAPFSLEFNTVKRIAPTAATLVFYDIAGTANSVRYTVYNGNTAASGGGFSANPVNLASTQWDKTMLSTKRATMLNNVTTAAVTESATRVPDAVGVIEFQYSIDCRLGVI